MTAMVLQDWSKTQHLVDIMIHDTANELMTKGIQTFEQARRKYPGIPIDFN